MRTSEAMMVDVVLIGGGHSHAIALREFAMDPIPGVNVTLISDRSVTPYSGMLPGYLAGKYTYDECHIDLRKLMAAVGGQFLVDKVTGLDPNTKTIFCDQHPAIRYDWISFDIGSTPVIPQMSGALEHGIPVKPWQPFLKNWTQWTTTLQGPLETPLNLVIVGAGAGGVELAFNADAKLTECLGPRNAQTNPWTIHLIHRGSEILAHHNPWVREQCDRILAQRGIQVHLNSEIDSVSAHELICNSGLTLPFAQLFWVTGAAAPEWLRATELALTPSGFIQVDDTLQSPSHPNIFAAGDVATMINHPRPKAGVFAVRQGKPLAQNIRRAILGEALQPFQPQKNFLSLIGTGRDRAIASWGSIPLGLEADWLWSWKDQIDRKFMDQFEQLSLQMKAPSPLKQKQSPTLPDMHCAGCGSKVGYSILSQVLDEITQDVSNPDILIGLEGEDAAIVRVPEGQAIAHTVDYFRQLINDPYLFGQIASHHALSDLFAMGASPQTALAIATIPYGSSKYQQNSLHQLLSGAVKVLNEAGAKLVGGHTTEGEALAFGLSCNGLIQPDRVLRKKGLTIGDHLILTKPLGIGVIFAGQSQGRAKSQWIDHAMTTMLQSNQAAGQIAQEFGASACTDITGFGLLGHLWEMVKASRVRVNLDLSHLQPIPGALELCDLGVRSSLFEHNAEVQQHTRHDPALVEHPHWPLLFDPQTSGGLLMAISEAKLSDCLAALTAKGYVHSHHIGIVTTQNSLPVVELQSSAQISD